MLLSHRLADYASNPELTSTSGIINTPVGISSDENFPTGTRTGDISIVGIYCVYGRPQAIVNSAGFTQLSIRIYSGVAVALYAKALTSADITRGTTGFGYDSVYTRWNITLRGPNPFTSFTTRGLATAGGDVTTKNELAMTNTTQNPGVVIAHMMWNTTFDVGDYLITNASDTVYPYSSGGQSQGQRHRMVLEFLSSTSSTTARTTTSYSNIGVTRSYTETILCLNGVE